MYAKPTGCEEERKRFYNKEINSVAFCVFQTSLPFYATRIIIPFLTSRIWAIIIKGCDFSQSCNPYIPWCSSSVESLLERPLFFFFFFIIAFNTKRLTLNSYKIEICQVLLSTYTSKYWVFGYNSIPIIPTFSRDDIY